MRALTRPRPLYAEQLRPGDEICTLRTHAPIMDVPTFVDAELTNTARWVRVADVIALSADDAAERHQRTGIPYNGESHVLVVHHKGEVMLARRAPVFCREGIHFDPWTYVKPVKDAD